MPDKPKRGNSFPLGSTLGPHGVNFSVYSPSAARVELVLFSRSDAAASERTVELHPVRNRTGDYWHVLVPESQPGDVYGYRVYGPADAARGLRFDPEKILLDPYARCVSTRNYSRSAAMKPGDNAASSLKSVVVDSRGYDWEGDLPLRRPFSKTVIYEVHVGGFTGHVSSDVAPEKRATYSGLVDKIPYLQDLGITAVELLPVFQFDPSDAPAGLTNYWGYSPISFFAPHTGYSSWSDPVRCLHEFKDMVKALHRAGIEVILDAVYNHTAEGNEHGPTLSYRGFANAAYYTLDPEDRRRYADFTGCGNTLNANHSIVRRMILDSVHYWVSEMHVDGIRFDLASILSRDESGRPMTNAPILSDLESDPVLAGTKLIAEAWDIQLYQVGSFARGNWKEWNGRYRDSVRGFLKGDADTISEFADCIVGSPRLYGWQAPGTEKGINFITCHDGFTLNDLVSYNRKHNNANGEENRDGTDDNRSWNCGAEGDSANSEVQSTRNRQLKNFLSVMLLSAGTPMLLMGDEVRRTQFGNNNAYCQDNDIAWFDWGRGELHPDILRFVQQLTRIRAALYGREIHRNGAATADARAADRSGNAPLFEWHGVHLNEPDWSRDSHSLALTVRTPGSTARHFMINAYWQPLEFELPVPPPSQQWFRLIDTSLAPPGDILAPKDAPAVCAVNYRVAPRSIVALLSRRPRRQRCQGSVL
jgi:isoamylase